MVQPREGPLFTSDTAARRIFNLPDFAEEEQKG